MEDLWLSQEWEYKGACIKYEIQCIYIKDTKTVSEGTKYINIIIDVNLQT